MKFFIAIVFLIQAASAYSQVVIIPFKSKWKYIDNGTNQGTSWRSTTFNDATWKTGNAELGYGDGDEATVVSYGPKSSSKYLTTYFRTSISIPNPKLYSSFNIGLKRDDGAVVYINGVEVFRSNMPNGTISNSTKASSTASDDGATTQSKSLANTSFISGTNVIAVEIHQDVATSSDISFDFSLTGISTSPNLLPTSNAGVDQTITLPVSSTSLTGSGSDPDGTISAYSWSQVSGPKTISFSTTNTASTIVSGLTTAGNYICRLTVTDNLGGQSTDDIQVIVLTANQLPTSNAGVDQTITLPVSSTSLTGSGSDPDGTISAYSWSQVSGPKTISFSTTNTASTIVSGLTTAGNYICRLTVTDNLGGQSTDDIQVTVSPALQKAILTRGPYLQMANENSVIIRWRTDIASNSRIQLGTSTTNYSISIDDSNVLTEHSVKVTGLEADTKYYYTIGNSSDMLQGSSSNYFTTSPTYNTSRKLSFSAFGDCGKPANSIQSATLNAYLSYTSGNPAELMLLLGDNAYSTGTDAEYQANFFNTYGPTLLKNHILFPAPGNHDYGNVPETQANPNIAYFKNFTTPTNGECGGVPSNSAAYYSYNWGNVHFLSLDSHGNESGNSYRLYDTLSNQVKWIKADLEANTRPWTIVYWHHPPYTMGSHNSDTESELVYMRENLLRILERYGVDLVLCGHSHDYERSYLLKDHFGNESSFNPTLHTSSTSNAKYDGSQNSCPYVVSSDKQKHGTVYVVSGSSGTSNPVQTSFPHNAMPFSINDGGMFYFEVEGNRLDAKFIRQDGSVGDKFTIMKDAGRSSNIEITSGTSTELTASWIGDYKWSTNETTKTISVTPTSNTTYTVVDQNGCITDQFNINLPTTSRIELPSENNLEESNLKVFPTPIRIGETLNIIPSNNTKQEYQLLNMEGMIIKSFFLIGRGKINLGNITPGVYILKSQNKQKIVTKKIIALRN